MNPREGNNFIVCSQAYGPDFGFQGVGQGVDPMNAKHGNERNNLRIWNFGGNLELGQDQLTNYGRSGYKVYAVDFAIDDDANTSEFECMLVHKPEQGPPRGHLVNHNVNHEGHASHLNTNDANLNPPEFVGVMKEETSIQ